MKMIRDSRKNTGTGVYFKTEENTQASIGRKITLGEERNIAKISLAGKTGICLQIFPGREDI